MTDVRASLLLLFTTPSEEGAIQRAARRLGLPFKRLSGTDYYPLGDIGTERVTAVRCDTGPLGYRGSAATALQALVETQAQAVATVGMCFGVREDVQLYRDVLVSTALVPYDRRDVRADATGSKSYVVGYRPASRIPASPALVAAMRRGLSASTFPFEVHFGALLSGGALIHSTAFRDELVSGVPAGDDPIVGGEMEGVGLLATSPPDDPRWIVVKGISDFGSDDGGAAVKEHRKQACQNAVDYFFHALTVPPEGR